MPTLNHLSKYIIVSSVLNSSHLTSLEQNLRGCNIFNLIIIYNYNGTVYTSEINFADYIKSIRVLVGQTTYRSTNTLLDPLNSLYGNFLDYFSEQENVSLSFDVVKVAPELITQIFQAMKHERSYDLFLSATTRYFDYSPKLRTYEEVSFCIFAPIPKKNIILQAALLKPFDCITWVIVCVITIILIFLWKLTHSSNSHWRLLCVMTANFLAQSVTFKYRNLLFLVSILFSLLVRNIYEGTVTSLMAERYNDNKFNTFDQFLKSQKDFKFYASEAFDVQMKFSQNRDYQLKKENILRLGIWTSKALKEKRVIALDCAEIENYVIKKPSILKSYYLLPERLFTYYRLFDVGFTDPFLPKLQHRLNQVFEIGVIQAWTKWNKNVRMIFSQG